MRRARLLLPFALLVLLSGAAPADGEGPAIDGKAILRHLQWLADDDREGRATGSSGADAAADYLAVELATLGVEPLGDEHSFLQRFPIPQGFTVLPATRLEATSEGKTTTIEVGDDLVPLALSAPGEVEAAAVFCGYGISAPDLGYDDYAGIEVKDRVAIVLRHAPGWEDGKSPFADPAVQRRYASFEAKVSTAVGAGAAAVVIVNDPLACWKPRDDRVESGTGTGGKVPVLHVTLQAGKRLFKTCDLSLQSEQKAIDARRTPRSRLLEGTTLRVVAALEAKHLEARNVCGVLRASAGAGASGEALVVGAHFDHLGRGESGSLAGSKGVGEVHNGADDNASGTAAVLEIARFLAARRDALQRDVVFVLFTGEELGLLGSKHFVEHPPVPLASITAMVNLDMVGRLENGRLQVGGTGTSPVFKELLEAHNRAHRIKLRLNPGGRAPSDNLSFYEKGIPVLFFFTGLHGDYHRPDDDVKEIDARGLEKVTALAADVCLDLASRPGRPPFTRSDASGLDAGPYLGLSCEGRADGVYVIHVEPGSPADKVGLQVGDKVEEFGGSPVRTMSDLQDAHRRAPARKKVEIVVRRGPRTLVVGPVLGDA